MCGIAGLVNVSVPIDESVLRRMTDAVAHRGPDGAGTFRDGPVGLGHRRLAIVDLSAAGAQPMHYRDRYAIVYNGEVYNHVELRCELETLGHVFVSHADTEVILAAYAQWGSDCLSRFNGMWAFLLYDRIARTLFVARDRFGVKPLYYRAGSDGTLAFASEIKQFTVLPDWQARLDGQRAYDYLAWGALDHDDATLFAGVFQLRGGECCLLDLAAPLPVSPGSRLPVRRWYSLPLTAFDGDPVEGARRFRELFTDAVRLRLRADVPVGSCLSGGLDSSSIVCTLSRLLGDDLRPGFQKTFSARSRVPALDEWRYAETVAKQERVDAHTVFPDADGLFDDLGTLLWHQDEPFGSTSIYAQWCVFRLARETGVKVVLDGQGADEQLAGYTNFIGPLLAGLLRAGCWRAAAGEWRALARERSAMVALASVLGVLLPSGLRQPVRALAGERPRPDWLALSRLEAGGRAVRARDPQAGVPVDSLRAHSRAQIDTASLPMLLHWEDRDSMAHGVEARVPFLDYRLVELVYGMPDEFKLHDGVAKTVLRAAMHDVLPAAVLARRDKMGFVTAEENWMRHERPERFRQAMRQSVDAAQGVLSPRILADLEDVLAGRRRFTHLPWRQLCFGAWMARFGVQP